MFFTPLIAPSTASFASSATSLAFDATFSATPSASVFVSPVTLPRPSLTEPLTWFNLSYNDIAPPPFSKEFF